MSRNEREFANNYRSYAANPYNSYNYNRGANGDRVYRSGSGYSPSRTQLYELQPYGAYNNMYKSSAPKSVSSKLADLNQRLMHQTQMIRVRGLNKKNFDTRSSSSREDLRRSRYSADGQRRSSPYRPSSNIRPHYYNENPHPLASSRHSEQILSRPIITHNSVVRQPILSNSRTQNFYPMELPSFKKIDSREPVQMYLGQPILPNVYAQNEQSRSMFNEIPQNRNVNLKPILKKTNKNDESIEQFLDMDLRANNKPSMESISSLPDSNWQASPVSPMAPFYNTHLQKRPSQKLQPQSMKSLRQVSPIKRSESLLKSVPQMIKKTELAQGKVITVVLIGIAMILVIFQAIK